MEGMTFKRVSGLVIGDKEVGIFAGADGLTDGEAASVKKYIEEGQDSLEMLERLKEYYKEIGE